MFAPAMLRSAYRAVENRVRDSVLLERAERAASALTPEQHAAMRKYYDAAMRRLDVANDLVDERGAVPALILYREVVQLLIAAVIISRRAQVDVESLRTPAAWLLLAELAGDGQVPEPPPAIQPMKELLAQGDPLALDSCSAEELVTKRASAEAAVRWLAKLVEPRTPQQIRVSRAVYVGVVAVAVLAALAWSVVSLLKAPNLALHKPVTISERHPQSNAPADNSGLVNGDIEPAYGIHTTAGNAWVTVDLRESYRVSNVKVYNRGDGWGDEGLPFFLEFSEDGNHFVEVDRRTTTFSSSSPWVHQAGGRRARFVRVRSDKYIALTELEVYGRK